MNLFKNPLSWIIGILILLALWGVGTYNSLISKTNSIEGQWKQVEASYQRRFDLVPNLVESVKGLMAQEQKIFSDIAEARTRYGSAAGSEGRVQAVNQLEGALGRLIVIFENYPQIKSDQAVLTLMDELSGTENRIAIERKRYNEKVQDYNTSVSVFPGNTLASAFGFTKKTYFEATKGAEQAPKVDFNR